MKANWILHTTLHKVGSFKHPVNLQDSSLVALLTATLKLLFQIYVWALCLFLSFDKRKDSNLLQIGAGQHGLQDNRGHYGICSLL